MTDISLIFIELGIIIIGLSVLTRLASRWGFSSIPLYLLAGLAFGIGAFLAGIALSQPIARRTQNLLEPLRDLFAAIFFLFFGLQIDPASLPPVLLLAVILGLVTALTKLITGWWAARRAKLNSMEALRSGAALVARGEFSIVIAGLGVSAGIEPQLGSLSAAYVLFLAILGPILARYIEPLSSFLFKPPSEKVPGK